MKELSINKKEILSIIHGDESNTILFAGDSVTHGPLHTKGYRSYSEHLKERLRGESINGKLKVDNFIINTGVSSAQTKDVLARYETWIAKYNPKIVFLTFGMNDCVGTTLAIYKENLRTLVKKVREIGAIPIIQTVNTTNGAREDELPSFMEGARIIANELDVFLIDHNQYWKELGKSVTNEWLGDAIHPNEKGQLELAKLIFRELKLDTEDSYTQKLSYPLEGSGTAKPILDVSSGNDFKCSKVGVSNNFTEIRNKTIQSSIANSWVLIGDASNSGNGATYGYKNYGEYFEERIRWELSADQMIARERYVIDSAVDGADSKVINENFNKWVAIFNPDIVSIMIGGNEKGTPKEFEASLKQLIQKSRDINATVMLQTPVLQENDITPYVNIILNVGKELNIPVVDHYNTWKALEKNNSHLKEAFLNKDYKLNHRGHLRVAQDMMKALGIFDSNSISAGAKVDMKYEVAEDYGYGINKVIN